MTISLISILSLSLLTIISCEPKWAEGNDDETFIHLESMSSASEKVNQPLIHSCMDKCIREPLICKGFNVTDGVCSNIGCAELVGEAALLTVNSVKVRIEYQEVFFLEEEEAVAQLKKAVSEMCPTKTTLAPSTSTTTITAAPSTTTTTIVPSPATIRLQKPGALRPLFRSQYTNGNGFFKLGAELEWDGSELVGSSDVAGRIIPYSAKSTLDTICEDTQCLSSLYRRRATGSVFQLLTGTIDVAQENIGVLQKVLGFVAKHSGCCGATKKMNEHSKAGAFDYNSTDTASDQWTTKTAVFYMWEM